MYICINYTNYNYEGEIKLTKIIYNVLNLHLYVIQIRSEII